MLDKAKKVCTWSMLLKLSKPHARSFHAVAVMAVLEETFPADIEPQPVITRDFRT